MKFFSKPIKYQLITQSTWGNSNIDELVFEGTRTDIEAYAKKSKFMWNEDDTQPTGGFYTRSIDGYRKKTYKIIEAK
tara:strand:+ start:126713 stop:126943 length:231 start_codon:yes stop_codon:yes gene_type:complete